MIATGIRSNSHLARRAGLEVNQGVVVNNLLATSHPDILAAGDVAEHHGQVYGIWGPSQYQGSIAGLNLAGGSVEFGGVPRSNTLKVLGLDLFSIGRINAEDASFQAVEQEADGRYFRFVFQDNRLVGAVLLGDTVADGRGAASGRGQARLFGDPGKLADGRPDRRSPGGGAALESYTGNCARRGRMFVPFLELLGITFVLQAHRLRPVGPEAASDVR